MPTDSPRPTSRPTRGRLARLSRNKGVVLVITLLAVVLLAALVLYVFNMGQQTNARIAAQNEADSAANAGAGWVARSLNTVAMNNTAMARLISNIAVIDALPLAVEFTYKEQLDAHTTTDQQGLSQAMEQQLSRGIEDWWVRDKVNEMVNRIGRANDSRQQEFAERAEELRILESFDQLFNSPHGDVAALTFYNAPGGRGLLWQAMYSLDELNMLTMENLGILAQLNAVRGAQVNADSRSTPTTVMLPVEPSIPWKRGEFRDFQRPVRQGLLPRDTDDKETNRGPYDAVHGWRQPRGGRATGYSNQTSVAGGGRGNVNIGRGTDQDFVVTGREDATAYTVYGPHQWMMHHASNMRRNNLRFSRFDHWLRVISEIKLQYAFGSSAIQTIIDPKWQIRLQDAIQIAENNRSSIVETAFVVVEIKSRYPLSERPPTPEGMLEGPNKYWQYVTRHRPSMPWVTRQRGWVDPNSWNIQKINDHIWRDEWTYQVYFDRDLGIEPQYDAQGQMIPQPVYRIDHYIFAGVNIGEPVQVRNPFNFSGRQGLPAPVELDLRELGPRNMAARDHYLRFMTVVRHNEKAPLWPTLFASRSPGKHNMAVAQAEVFNDHSWDLWTQMWRSQLRIIEAGQEGETNQFSQWVRRFENQQENMGIIPDFTEEDAQSFLEYLRSIEPLAPAMLNH